MPPRDAGRRPAPRSRRRARPILAEALALLRRARLRRHVAERHRRRRRHPPAEPAAPLPVEGGAVPRGLRAPARRTGSTGSTSAIARPRRGWDKVELRARAPASSSSPTTPTTCASCAARRSTAARTSAIDLAAVLRPMFDAGRRLLRAARWRRARSAARPRAAAAHRLRRAAQLLLRRAVPRGPARRRPARSPDDALAAAPASTRPCRSSVACCSSPEPRRCGRAADVGRAVPTPGPTALRGRLEGAAAAPTACRVARRASRRPTPRPRPPPPTALGYPVVVKLERRRASPTRPSGAWCGSASATPTRCGPRPPSCSPRRRPTTATVGVLVAPMVRGQPRADRRPASATRSSARP